MCGIIGVVKTQKASENNIKILVDLMSEQLLHRGPDDYGFYADEFCGLGIRRLSILDLTTGLYPFSSDDKNIQLVLNGEIYNYPQLKSDLEKKGVIFKTTCDAEVILKGFELYGIDYIEQLRGMFAIAIWVKNSNVLYLVRDRLGIKPLYFFEKDHTLFFASEIKSFLALKKHGYDFNLNETYMRELLGFMYFPRNDATIVEDIYKLEPGTYLKIKNDHKETIKYWDIRNKSESLLSAVSETEVINQVEDLITDCIKMHMLADVPVGLFLSGGVDSSVIAGILVKKLGYTNLNTFTAHFNHKFDESGLAKLTAKYLGTTHNDIFIDTTEINKNIESYIKHFDSLETFDGGLLTTAILSSRIREHGEKVVLLGEGADEIFGGYSWFGLSKLPFSLLPKYLRNIFYYYAISRNVSKNFWFYINLFNKFVIKFKDKFKEISFNEITNQLPNHFLMKVDKGSMASSVEARVPFLDHKLVEYVFNIDNKLKYKGIFPSLKKINEKYILRKIAEKYIPMDIAWRKKRGFLLPIGDILTQDISKVKSYILATDAISRKFFTEKELLNLFKKSRFNIINMNNEYFLWRLFILEVWFKNFFKIS